MSDRNVIDVEPSTALVQRSSVQLEPVMDVPTALKRMERLQEFCGQYLQESADGGTDGGDFGVIPGAGKKKVLLKSGADKLCDVYALADTYVFLSKIEDFDAGLFDYTLECRLLSRRDDSLVGSGLGSCSSYESKYRYREGGRRCPACGEAAIIRGKAEYGGGWVCFKKKNGCGAKFKDADPVIVGQSTDRVLNPDLADMKNTILKMAKKRAKIDAVISVTRSSGIFTQDVEDTHRDEPEPAKPAPQQPPREAPRPVTAGPVDITEGMPTTAPATITVVDVSAHPSQKNPARSWYGIRFSDGRHGTTWSKELADAASEAQKLGATVDPQIDAAKTLTGLGV